MSIRGACTEGHGNATGSRESTLDDVAHTSGHLASVVGLDPNVDQQRRVVIREATRLRVVLGADAAGSLKARMAV